MVRDFELALFPLACCLSTTQAIQGRLLRPDLEILVISRCAPEVSLDSAPLRIVAVSRRERTMRALDLLVAEELLNVELVVPGVELVDRRGNMTVL